MAEGDCASRDDGVHDGNGLSDDELDGGAVDPCGGRDHAEGQAVVVAGLIEAEDRREGGVHGVHPGSKGYAHRAAKSHSGTQASDVLRP